MAGAQFSVEFNSLAAQDALNLAVADLKDPKPLLRDIGEYLMRAHMERFKSQVAPDGMPWAPLTPRYMVRKKKNKNRILFLDGYLANTLRYQVDNGGLAFGTNRPYAAIHQFGGEISMPARQRTLYFKRTKDGGVGNRFVKQKKSDFAQDVNVGPYKIKMPKREFLGTSDADNLEILNITLRHWERALGQN